MAKNITILLITMYLSGCASILSKSDYPVTLNSTPQGAEVTVTDVKTGSVIYKGSTPNTITLKAKHGFFSPARYQLSFRMNGYETQTFFLGATLDGWYIGNLLFVGVIGLLIVDPATGAMWKLPDTINVTLEKLDTLSLIHEENQIHIISYHSLPIHLRDKVIKIN